jgi:YteA family regulatory protein
MDKAKLAELKERLSEEKKKLLAQIKFIDEQGLNTAMDDSLSELSTYDNHPADIGTEMFERSKDFALRERAMVDLVAVDNALDRIENGNYGVCDVCGEEIALERLEAKPSTAV